MLRPLVLSVVFAAVLALPSASASASQRFAAPTGAGSVCSSAAPCALATAFAGAVTGDEIVLGAGTYTPGAALVVPSGLDVHGAPGAAASTVIDVTSLDVAGRIADLTLQTSSGPVLGLSGLGERLNILASGTAVGVGLTPGAVLRDSVVVTANAHGLVWFTGAGGRFDLINDTIDAGGSGVAVYMNSIAPKLGPASVAFVRNTVARGDAGDLRVLGVATQTLEASHSAFRPGSSTAVTDGGGNVAAAPTFFADGTDFHQLWGSPTIDAGLADPSTGDLDLDGRPRTSGASIDIGAYESPGIPPSPAAPPAGNLLVNPGAETGPGATDGSAQTAIPGWTTTPAFTAVRYGASGGFPDTLEAARNGGGANFFAGGPATASSTARQVVDVSGRAADIDGGRVSARLAADLGGFASQGDGATVTASFRNAGNAELGSTIIGPVGPVERAGAAILLRREATAAVPAGTRSIVVTIAATNAGGALQYDDGYADNLSLTLAPPPAPVAPAAGGGTAPGRPALSALQLTPSSARPGATTTLRVTLDQAARLRILVQRARPGVLRRGRCLAPRKGLKGHRCTRWTTVRTVDAAGTAGANAIRIALRAGKRALPPGTYRVRVAASSAAGSSGPVDVTLRIRRPRR